jgi:hypothetical protein
VQKNARLNFASLSNPRVPALVWVIPLSLELVWRSKAKKSRSTVFWLRRQSTKFNGVPSSPERRSSRILPGRAEGNAGMISHYMKNASVIAEALSAKGSTILADQPPYFLDEMPEGLKSWEFFGTSF